MTKVLTKKGAVSANPALPEAVLAPEPKRRAARRPTRAEAQAIHQAILAAAWDEFLARGFTGARMDAIATAANVTRVSLYGRFPTKKALFREIAEQHFTNWTAARYIWDPTEGTLPQRLRTGARVLAAAIGAPEARTYRQLLNSAFHGYPEFPALAHQRGYLPLRDDFIKAIVTSPEGRRVTPQAAAEIAEFLIAAINGWVGIEASSGNLTQERAMAFVDRVVDMALVQAATEG